MAFFEVGQWGERGWRASLLHLINEFLWGTILSRESEDGVPHYSTPRPLQV
jgi:hypothetical protein